MEIGASSSCFYPLETEKSFLKLAEAGIKSCEIFFNSPSELNRNFLDEIIKIKDENSIEVVALHPYASFTEGYNFFSNYKRRFYDATEGFKRLFEAAQRLGAGYIVMHGSKGKPEIAMQEYAERFYELNIVAKGFGCTVAHENVVHYTSGAPDFMRFMKESLGDSFKAVLDVKQARRAGYTPSEFIDVLGRNIVHVHLSDYTDEKDCVLPSEKGLFCFEQLFSQLKEIGYDGKYIVEVYSDCFSNVNEILLAASYLDAKLKRVNEGR